MPDDPYKYFRVEARDLLEQIGCGVLDLERGARPAEAAPRLLRLAHTLKGAARVVRQHAIAEHAHALEDALAPLRDSSAAVPKETIDRLLAGVDAMQAGLKALAAPPPATPVATRPVASPAEEGAPPAPAEVDRRGTPSRARYEPAPPGPEAEDRTARADLADLDAILEGAAETRAHLATLRASLSDIDRARRLAGQIADQIAAPAAARGRSPAPAGVAASARQARAIAQELRALTGSAERAISGATGGLDRALRGLREAAERARLVPVATLFPALERLARDCARSVGCLARFQARGGEVRVEGRTLAAVNSALVQLVRNAVAHGIEPEAARRAAGKPAEGRVTVAVTRRGRSVVFSCEDDGCGLDLNGLRQALVQGGAPVDAARAMGPEALLSRLLRGGLSTAPVVTDASGRGLGLSVAREAAESLGGVLSARTEAGRGCAFDVTVPLALASFDALLVEAGGVTAAIPLEAVRGAARVAVADLAHGPAGVTATVNGAVLAFAPLPDLLGMAADDRPSRRAWNAALIAGDGATAALAVDRVRGVEHVLLRPLPPSSPGGDLVVGAFLDADGIPRLVLDPDALARAARGRRPEQPAGRAPAAVLVIDDSLTTRMLERSILESAGYQVDLAVSGEEALKMAGRRRYSLFLVDVEMPGMDGFTLVERFRADAALRDVPSILVTSRVSAEDRRRGEEVGAKGYIVKSEFDQNALLARMRDLIAKGP